MNIFENLQFLNAAQNPLMNSQANSGSTNNQLLDISLAASLMPALFTGHQQQQTQNNAGFGLSQNNVNLSANNNQSINQNVCMQLEYLQQVQLMKQQQQQQDQQREQYKLALITELLKLEQQSQQQQQQQQQSQQQQPQYSNIMGINEINISNQFNQQQQQQQTNNPNLLLELILQQNKINNLQTSEQTTPSSYLNEIQNQYQSQNGKLVTSQSPKCGEGSYESKTLSFIPSICGGSPQLMAQVSPQLKKEDESNGAQQNTQILRAVIEQSKNNNNNNGNNQQQMMELHDIMNATQLSQKKQEINQNDTNSLTKMLTQQNFDNSIFSSSQQQNIQIQQQQQQIVDGNNQNLDINIFLNQQNNDFEFQRKRQERLIKIEKYKNKRRNWLRKISYDCRKKVADSRLRIKGRFISKKDTEKIKELIGDNQEAFNAKKNLRLDFMNHKMRLQNLDLNPAISKNEILSQIEKLLLKNRQIHTNQTMQAIVKRIQKKQQVFCLIKRGQTEMIKLQTLSSDVSQHSSEELNEESISISKESEHLEMQN